MAIFSSPIGVSKEIGSLAILRTFLTLVKGKFHLFRNFFRGGFTSDFLNQETGRSNQFIDCFNHMDGDSDGSRLISDCASDGLPDPPGRIGAKLIPPLIFKFITALINPIFPS